MTRVSPDKSDCLLESVGVRNLSWNLPEVQKNTLHICERLNLSQQDVLIGKKEACNSGNLCSQTQMGLHGETLAQMHSWATINALL